MRGYKTLIASSVGERDGMGCELIDPEGETIAEVFEHDGTKVRTVTLFQAEVPLDVVNWYLRTVDERL